MINIFFKYFIILNNKPLGVKDSRKSNYVTVSLATLIVKGFLWLNNRNTWPYQLFLENKNAGIHLIIKDNSKISNQQNMTTMSKADFSSKSPFPKPFSIKK